MPTAKELDLFTQCDGGSGDARADEKLARNLGSIIDIPEQQMMSFIRTRDRNAVKELQNVLQEMPRKPNTAPGGARKSSSGGLRPGSLPGHLRGEAKSKSSSEARAGTASPTLSSGSRRQNAQARLQEMGTMKTSYGEVHGALGGATKSQTPVVAFDGVIKRGYKPDFEQWKECASENQVRVLADTCRALRFFNAGETAPTTYAVVHTEFPNHRPKTVPEKDNGRNVSVVPLGSIYTQSEKEARIAKRTQEVHEEHLMAATRTQAGWRSGTLANSPEGKLNLSLTATPHDLPVATVQKNMKAMPGSVTKSVSAESWSMAPHSPIQVKRHDHQFIKPGETAWAMCGLAGHTISEDIYALRCPKLFPGGGNPNYARVVTHKMARFADAREREKTLRGLSSSCPAF